MPVPVAVAVEDQAYAALSATPTADGRRLGVLLSHGFTGNPSSMRPWAAYLEAQGFAVSVPLLPGHGTTWKHLNTFTYDQWYATVQGALDELRRHVDVVFVAGLSMGGCLVLQAALENPEVAGVVVVNPGLNSERKDVKLLPVLKHLVGAFPGISSDIKKPGAIERAYPKTPLKAAHSLFGGMAALRARLPQLETPLLVYKSAVDHVLDPSSVRILMDTVGSKDLELRTLADSYHVATLDNDAETIFAGSADFFRRIAVV